MNFLSMEYFLATASERSFTRAADKLHITQQTLSANISNLEKELHTSLFIRHVPLELTYAGEVFLGYATDFHDRYQMMQKEFEDILEGKQGELKVGIGYTRGRTIMPALTALFQEHHPHYHVRLVEGSNEMQKQMLLDGEIDLAIGSFAEQEPGIDLYDLYNEETVLLVQKEQMERCCRTVNDRDSYPDARKTETGAAACMPGEADHTDICRQIIADNFQAFQNCPFVMSTPGDVSGAMGNLFFRHYNLRPEIKAVSDNVETLLEMCVRGVGACFVPRILMEMTLSAKQIDKLYVFTIPLESGYPIRFGVRHQSYQWSAIQEFMRIARESGLFEKKQDTGSPELLSGTF